MERRRYVVSRNVIGNKQRKSAGIWEYRAKIEEKREQSPSWKTLENRGL